MILIGLLMMTGVFVLLVCGAQGGKRNFHGMIRVRSPAWERNSDRGRHPACEMPSDHARRPVREMPSDHARRLVCERNSDCGRSPVRRKKFPGNGYLISVFLTAGLFWYEAFRRILMNFGIGFQKDKDQEKLKSILVSNDVEEEKQLFHAGNAGILLAGMLGCALCLIAVGYGMKDQNGVGLNEVTRPEYGGQEKTYYFTVEDECGNSEDVSLNLESRKYSEEEADQFFDRYFEIIEAKMKGSNESLDAVTENLDFSAEEGWEWIDVTFSTSDSELITREGTVNCMKADTEGSTVTIQVTMQYEEFSKSFEVSVNVIHKDTGSLAGIEEYLEQNANEGREEAAYELPKVFNGLNLQYSLKEDGTGYAGIGFIMFLLAVFIVAVRKNRLKEQYRNRNSQLEEDYPELISRFLILLRAGMPVRSAWERIVADYEREKNSGGKYHFVYEEMRLALEEMENGLGEGEAYMTFGRRCRSTVYLKFGNLLLQNLKKGSQSMAAVLEEERILSVESAGRQIRTKGELVGTKLMVPMILMFILVMAIIMVPALSSFQM